MYLLRVGVLLFAHLVAFALVPPTVASDEGDALWDNPLGLPHGGIMYGNPHGGYHTGNMSKVRHMAGSASAPRKRGTSSAPLAQSLARAGHD